MRANTNRTGALSFGLLATDYDVGRPRLSTEFLAKTAQRVGLPASGVGLEVGAGTGQLTGALLDAGWTVHALEPCPPMADRLFERYRDEVAARQLVVLDDAFETFRGASPGSFDAIWSADAWHWIDPLLAYHRSAELLKPGGRLVAIWTLAGLVEDRAVAGQLNEIYEELSPDLVRDPEAPVDESVLAAGRHEIDASHAMVVSDYWIEDEPRSIDRSTYVAWQLSYGHIVQMAAADRGRLSGAITNVLRHWTDGRQIPVRLWRYIVASQRVVDQGRSPNTNWIPPITDESSGQPTE